jgi:hypothetical protein
MKLLHWEVDAVEGTVVRVDLDAQANVMLDDVNFSSYRHGRRFRYYGGLAKRTPVTLVPPRCYLNVTNPEALGS